jgi:hypothetical protein
MRRGRTWYKEEGAAVVRERERELAFRRIMAK